MIRLMLVVCVVGFIVSACAPTKVIVKNCVELGADDMKQCDLIKKM